MFRLMVVNKELLLVLIPLLCPKGEQGIKRYHFSLKNWTLERMTLFSESGHFDVSS